MKTFAIRLTVIGLLLAAVAAHGATTVVPAGFNYQGKLLDAAGEPLATGNYTLSFALYEAATGGQPVWGPYTNTAVAVVDGVFNTVLVGDGTDILGAFGGSNRYLELKIGSNSPISERQRILAVPFAIRAESANQAARATDATRAETAGQADEATHANDADTVAGQVIFGEDNTTFEVSRIPTNIVRVADIPSLIPDSITRTADLPVLLPPLFPDLLSTTLATDPGDWGVGTSSDPNGLARVKVWQPKLGDGVTAIRGEASGATGNTRGVQGVSVSSSGRGVYGEATSSTGETRGVWGKSSSGNGAGVFGENNSPNPAFGLPGEISLPPPIGVWGQSIAASGLGVYGLQTSTSGVGVVGDALSGSGETKGVAGYAASSQGTGVSGTASHSSGTTFGVKSYVASPNGYSGFFQGGRNYFQGNVGIGNPSPTERLDIVGNVKVSGKVTASTGGSSFAGNVGIGTTTPQTPLDVVGNARITGEIVDPDAPATTINGQTITMRTSGTGNASKAINFEYQHQFSTLPSLLRINVDGQTWFTATEGKTFVIQHPTAASQYLVHATLEGPENAVYYRGEAQLQDGSATIELPHYFEALTCTVNRTVQLTAVDGFDRIAVRSQQGALIRDGRFAVISDNASSTQRFTWEVKAVRKDIAPLEVEVSKDDAILMGDGPYTYLLDKRPGAAAKLARPEPPVR